MFNTKQDVDRHVKTQLSKLPDEEKKGKGFTVAKYYFKVGDYVSAQNWVSSFLEVRDDNAQAHKLLGQCYEKLNKPERALQSYQKALQLDPKQTNLISEVCKLLTSNEELCSNQSRVKFWCDLAGKHHVQNEAVLNLKVKLADKSERKEVVEQLILQEIQARPADVGLRIRLVKFLVEEKRHQDAFKQCFDVEMKFIDSFAVSLEWYNTINFALSRYAETDKGHSTSWNYWLLTVLAMERQIFLQLSSESLLTSANKRQVEELASLLFEFDQTLKKADEVALKVCRELGAQFLYHYRGQFLLHAATLLFRMEKVYARNQWRETTKKALPLLLLAYQCGIADVTEPWLRTTQEQNRKLITLWHKQGAFRCAQAGRTILSCICDDTENSVIAQIRQVTNTRSWISADDVTHQIRQTCADSNWRKAIFRVIFPSHGISQVATSYFVQSERNLEPDYELPVAGDVEKYEDIALELAPDSLQMQIYLNLNRIVTEVQTSGASHLNFSVSNLEKCDPDTLNQIDLDTFLLCSLVQTKRALDADKSYFETYNEQPYNKPRILPMANMTDVLCTVDQMEWWTAVFQVLKNKSGENLAQVRAIIQNGVEAVRGEGSPKVDLIILLKVTKILSQRILSAFKAEEKRSLEFRVEHLYRSCLKRYKHTNGLGEYRLLFKFSTQNYNVDAEITELMETAIQFLAARFFKNNLLNECVKEFENLDFPFAAYFRAEAFKKLEGSCKTPRKSKALNLEKAKECYNETLVLLDDPQFKNHPLHSIVSSEIKRLHNGADPNVSNGIDSSFYDDARDSTQNSSRSRRDTSLVRHTELESMMRRMMEVLDSVKKEISGVRSEISSMRPEMTDLQQKVSKIEDTLTRQAEEHELYLLDELNNTESHQQTPIHAQNTQTPAEIMAQAASLSQQFNPYNTAYPMYMPPQYPPNPQAGFPGLYFTPPQQQPQPQPARFTPQPIVVPQVPKQQSSLEQALQTPSLINTWNSTYNSQMVEKGLPVNVVITNSDPLPVYNSAPAQQKLSVTIPPQHIKQAPAAPPVATYENITPPVKPVVAPFQVNPAPAPVATTSGLLSVAASKPVTAFGGLNLTTAKPSESKPAEVPKAPDVTNTNILTPKSLFGQVAAPAPEAPPKASPFASFTFGAANSQTPSKDYSSIFSSIGKTPEKTSPPKPAEPVATHDEDVAEEFVPTATFKPVIDLPDLVEAVTGEENEDVVFEHRAKLFRFDRETKEWKERGLGNMKILVSKSDPSKVRLLMRREQIHKVCCNQLISADTKFEKVDKPPSVRWHGPDFSENETQLEFLALRLKTPEIRDQFFDVLEKTKKAMGQAAPEPPKGAKKSAEKPKEEPKGWGDQFKSKAGSWTCEACYISNNADTLYCVACNSPKDDTVPKKPAENALGSTKFSFGVNPASQSSFSFGTGGGGFTFGASAAAPLTAKPATLGLAKPADSIPPAAPEPAGGFTFGSAKGFSFATPSFADLASSNKAKEADQGLQKENFTFVFKPRSPGKPKSPVSPGGAVSGDDQTDDEYHEEENNTHFTPVVQLAPVEVKTGEEDEEAIFTHRAKLFRFDASTKEWKERGIGDVKILKHKQTSKLRVLMRREQIHKICLNHALTREVEYQLKNEKNWLFNAGDYSEGELEARSFCLRFKTPEVAMDFKKAVDAALSGGIYENGHGSEEDKDMKEDQKLVQKLQLPPDFFDYKRKDACKGCIGCKSEEFVFQSPDSVVADKPIPLDFSAVRKGVIRICKPKRVSFSVDEKPQEKSTISIFGGSGEDKTKDLAKSIFSSAQNTMPKSPDGFSLFGEARFGPTTPSKSIFGGTPAFSQSSPFENKPVFGSDKPIFGNPLENKPVFGTVPESKPVFGTVPESKPVFGGLGATQTGTPLFGGAAMFGAKPAGVETSTPPSVFGSLSSQTPAFGGSTFSFAQAAKTLSPDTNGNPAADENRNPAPGFLNAESLSFASLVSSSSTNAFCANKDTGSGEFFGLTKKDDIFTKLAKQKASGNLNESTEEDANANEENYDPHYDPIIQLPDEIEVKTGEEEETKVFGERAKLYRYCNDTKEWKERGVGELKILHHPGKGSYRLLMRREQIFKLVLNHVISDDFHVSPMQSSNKAYVWAAMNYTDEGPAAEKLAARFKNEDLADQFRGAVEKAVEAVQARGELEPEDD